MSAITFPWVKREDTFFGKCSPMVKYVVVGGIIYGGIFSGFGIYAIFASSTAIPAIWGYVITSIGAVTISGSFILFIISGVYEWLKKREDIQSPTKIFPRREIEELDFPDEEQNAIVSSSIVTLPNEMIYRIIHEIISIDSEKPRQIEASKNLCRVAATCKRFRALVNAENTDSRHLLDCVYRIGSVLFKNIGCMNRFFPKEVRDKAYITDEIFDNHDAFFAPSGRPEVENMEKWNEWMASKKVSIAYGINRDQCRFLAVHVHLEENNKLYEGVLVFSEETANDDDSWKIRYLFKNEDFSFPSSAQIQEINGKKQKFSDYSRFYNDLFKNGTCTITTYSDRVISARLAST